MSLPTREATTERALGERQPQHINAGVHASPWPLPAVVRELRAVSRRSLSILHPIPPSLRC
jgi:hypothetical protein